MERDGRSVDLGALAQAMRPYARGRLHHLRHGRSLRVGRSGGGALSRGDVRAALGRSNSSPSGSRARARSRATRRARRWSARSTGCRDDTIDLLQFHAWTFDDPRWLDTLGYLDELRAEGLIRHLGRHQLRHRAPAHRAGERNPDRLQPGELLAHRSARRRRDDRALPGARREAPGLRHGARRVALRAMAREGRTGLGATSRPGRR